MQAVDMAAAKFAAKERKNKPASQRLAYDTASALKNNMGRYPDEDSTGTPCTYCMGFLLVPPNTQGDRLSDFVPVTALDWCSAKGLAQGSFVVRGTHDADGHLVPVSLAKVFCCEAIPGCDPEPWPEPEP